MRASRPTLRRARARRSGMTLIEIMVAMAILSIITALLYNGFVQTSRNKERVEADLDRAHEIRLGIERIASELSAAFVSAQRQAISTAPISMKTAFIAKDANGGSRIDFTSFSHRRLYRNAHESDQNELAYFVTNDPKKSGERVLARREQRRPDDDSEKGGEAQILIQNIKKFELSFFDPLSSQWVTTWDTTQSSMQFNRLPSQAKILVTVPSLHGKGPDQTFGTRTWFPITYALNFTNYKGQ